MLHSNLQQNKRAKQWQVVIPWIVSKVKCSSFQNNKKNTYQRIKKSQIYPVSKFPLFLLSCKIHKSIQGSSLEEEEK